MKPPKKRKKEWMKWEIEFKKQKITCATKLQEWFMISLDFQVWLFIKETTEILKMLMTSSNS